MASTKHRYAIDACKNTMESGKLNMLEDASKLAQVFRDTIEQARMCPVNNLISADAAASKASIEMVTREYTELTEALVSLSPDKIAYQLRSIADMMKGLIDLGASWPSNCAPVWLSFKKISADAHKVEKQNRR